MVAHLRACLWLLILTIVLCCGVYPLVLWGIGQAMLRHSAEGSLVRGPDGKTVVGARLIAQPFTSDEFFRPRPSAVTYNAAASGASNWGAANPLLRDRVARALGPIVKYRSGARKGQLVGEDVETWFKEQAPDYVATWASDHSASAEQWVKDNPDAVALWLGKEVDDVKNAPGDAAKVFFAGYAKRHPRTWPTVEEAKAEDGETVKRIKPADKGSDLQAYLFDPWLQEHKDADLEAVPADLVMASGSGLDPHITLKNALYQLDRVVSAWAEKTKSDPAAVRAAVERVLAEKTEAPLGGLVGVPLVNVLEVNLALTQRMPRLQAAR
ncbi:MAG: potassium-transporting ATPase subunit C [Gemmataceae bacterium]|nr:potassium-transporting ATPase subunit C [Gemmataceae bacterium]